MIPTGGLFFAILSILLTGISQTILKWAAGRDGRFRGFIGDYLKLPIVCAYAIFVLVTISTVLALREIDLKVFYALTGLNFVVVVIFSSVFLKEEVNPRIIGSVLIIILGVAIFNLDFI
ncbi:hypothetical protein [Methanogenium organophilum]|uniref:EamA domain-containing protein n=1 Tax=Methanogenium organophilum TaxID=2199 RepID=A0A9X9S488_METOG|nr:hypothetical protein [Methanogenium organophilum]WAI01200.1 hypothetical protein OU421_12425 [Methanogenium organophilum]